jgi:hypothetical protein
MKRELAVQGAILFVLLLIVFPRVFFGFEYAVASGLMGQFEPWRSVFGDEMRANQSPLPLETVMAFHADYTLVKQQLANGEWPLWNPLQFGGKPLLANYQSTVFYPPRLLHAFLPVALATTLFVLLKLWLCGMTAYLYGRVLTLSVNASRFLSIAWMIGGYTFAWAYWTPTDVAIWVPVIFIGVEFLIGGRYRRGFFALALGATLLLLAGHPESAFVFGLGAGLYFVIRVPGSGFGFKRIVTSSGIALAAWMIALAVCAVQILPFAEYASVSNNVSFRESGTEARHAIPVNEWVSALVPRYFGTNADENYRGVHNYTFNHMLYPGIAVWIGVLLAIGSLRYPKRRRVLAWLGVTIVLGLFAFDLPIVRDVLALPVLSALWQCYFGGFVVFGAAVIAAMGYDAWSKQPIRVQSLYPVVFGVALVALLLIPRLSFDFASVRPDGQAGYLAREMGTAALLAGLVLAALYVGIRMKLPSRTVVAVTVLLAIDLAWAGRGVLPTTPPDHHFPETPLTNRLAELPPQARIDAVSNTEIRPGLLTPHGVEEHWGYDGILPARIIAFHALLGDSERASRMAGVTHRLVLDDDADEPIAIEPRPDTLPRAYTVFDWEFATDEQALDQLRDHSFDPSQRAILNRDIGISPEFSGKELVPATMIARQPTRVVLQTGNERPGVLVLLDAYFPGWSATVDGNPAEIAAANYAFRGVALPAGEHEIVFEYDPQSFRYGLTISSIVLGVSFVFSAALLAYQRRKALRT